MKKLVYLSMAIAVGVAAASCQKVELTPSENTEGSSFALNASIEQTKTTINGLEVNWEEGDVLYLVTTDGTWGMPYTEDKTASSIAEYTYSAGTFASEATIADGTYTFNALYGSASQKSYHRGASTTYKLESTQSQDCSNPTEHLKLNDALVGTFKATVPMADPAAVSMSHIFAIMRVDVKNATGADVELKSFEMSAVGATLAGVFTVNFENSPIDITEKAGQSSSIKVNLTNGALASGASLPVYFVMAPLADYSGDVTFTVTDVNDLEYTKTVALNNISFEAGSLNTTPYTIKTGVAPEKTIYSTEFNYSLVKDDNGQTYYNKGDEYIGTDTDATTSWGITYGNWNGSNCAQLRVYSAGNFGSVYTKFDVSYATKVSYKAKVSNTALTLNTYYSTDSGKNWVKVDDAKALSTTLTEYSFTISETGEFAKNRIKFEVSGTAPSSSNYQLTIDDVSIYGNGEVLETVITKLDEPVVTCTAQTANSLTFSWGAVANATGYKVSVDGGISYGSTLTETKYTWTGLSASTTKTLYVKAIGDGIDYTDSEAASASGTTTAGSGSGSKSYCINATDGCFSANESAYQAEEKSFTANDGSVWLFNGYSVSAGTSFAIGKGGANYITTPSSSNNIKSITVNVKGNTSYYLTVKTSDGNTELLSTKYTNASEFYEYTFDLSSLSDKYTQVRLVSRRASGTSNAAGTFESITVTYE